MDKKYYWIKIKDTMFTSDAVDFLMAQKNGCNYVVLYQMLCLKTINTNGELVRHIGEVIIPYDVDKIVRDCKYFDRDTVIVALSLYEKLGLVYKAENGYLKISNYENMVGSEWTSAERMRRLRERENIKQIASQCDTECDKKVSIDKDIDKEKDKDIDILKEKYKQKEKYEDDFLNPIPTLEEVKEYITLKDFTFLPEDFYNYYSALGWQKGGTQIRNWQFLCETWQKNDLMKGSKKEHTRDYEERKYSEDELARNITDINSIDIDEL